MTELFWAWIEATKVGHLEFHLHFSDYRVKDETNWGDIRDPCNFLFKMMYDPSISGVFDPASPVSLTGEDDRS